MIEYTSCRPLLRQCHILTQRVLCETVNYQEHGASTCMTSVPNPYTTPIHINNTYPRCVTIVLPTSALTTNVENRRRLEAII